MVDAIISAVVEDLTSMMLSTIKEEVKLVTGVNDDVKKLVRNFKNIQDLLDDAEEQQLKEASVKNWLLDLKTVSYDMDDVIDEWKTWIQTSQRQLRPRSSDPIILKHKVLSIFRCNCFTLRDVGLRHVVGRRIKEIHQTLDDIAANKVRLQLNSTNRSDKHIERHVTTSFVETQKVKGREREKDQVKSMILEAKSNLHIISLVGLGGIGKTTLAQLIYHDREIQSHFEKKIWVCVSEPFDEMHIAKSILESLDKSSSTRDLKELNNVVEEIRTILNQKMFLLVLDDVWNESCSKWETLKQSLTCGLPGSTILITTRKETVATVMGCNSESIHKVGLLTPEECWSIISQVTLVEGDGQRLEGIGRRIAEKCKGLPLVANTVGGLLRFKKSEKEWLRVLEKKEWKDIDVLGPLKLSYYDLPLSLKQCFKYCAIFPKDSKIYKSRLTEMWMAQGYLRGKEEKEDLEIIGGTYFDNLISRSLFQSVDGGTIVLHDMVSDLAQTFAKDECLMIEVSNGAKFNENSLRSNANARHLTLVIDKDASFPVFIYGLNKLRSLIIQFLGYESSLAVNAVKNIFDRLTCLRTLNLSKCGIKEVPSSINRLVHLRWLDLSRNKNLEKLPKTLCECYNLQTLNLLMCPIELPPEIGNLINLMFLDIRFCIKIKYLPKGFGNLLHLKELRHFIVGVYENKTSCIVEMEKLNNLRKDLVIRGLGNVRKVEEARKAQLMKKKNVTGLELIFDGDHVQEDEEELLKALEPPSDLETLSIEEYEGKTFPNWMMKLNLLRVLTITDCRNCEELPPLGKLSSLEELHLKIMGVKRVGIEFLGIEKEKETATPFLSFPKLKRLVFSDFLEWKEWDDVDGWSTESFNNTITVMPCLNYLRIARCLKLKTLPYCLLSPTITPKLQWLYIVRCYALQQIQTDKLSHIPKLYIEQLPQAEQEEEKEDGEEDEEEEEKEEERGICF